MSLETDEDGLIRLQKLLAQSGVASRRKCEELMLAGSVEVDGEVVTRLGTKVDPTTAVIRVDGVRLPPVSPHVYLVLNKPRGVVSTMSDPEGRRSLAEFVADRPERLFHVGRLDTDTGGLILLTNDGDFAQRVAHPSYELSKTYVAEVDGTATRATVRRLLSGVELEDGRVEVSAAKVLSTQGERSLVELVIHEGRNRIVRRLLEHVGHPVRQLTRTAIGPVPLWACGPGSCGSSRWPSSVCCSTPPAVTGSRVDRVGAVAVRAVRGATQLEEDVREHLLERVAEMVLDVMQANDLEVDDFISVIFTATSDLVSEFPAYAARRLGFGEVPLICARELEIAGSMPRVVRMLAHVETDRAKAEVTHVYLHGAAALRRDLTRVREVPDDA